MNTTIKKPSAVVICSYVTPTFHLFPSRCKNLVLLTIAMFNRRVPLSPSLVLVFVTMQLAPPSMSLSIPVFILRVTAPVLVCFSAGTAFAKISAPLKKGPLLRSVGGANATASFVVVKCLIRLTPDGIPS